MRAAIYTRISKDDELEGRGVERQAEDLRAAAGRMGATAIEKFEDNDISAGGSKRRPAWERLATRLEAGDFDVVFLTEASRLSREPKAFLRFDEACEKYNLTVVYGGSTVNFATGDGRFAWGIYKESAMEELRVLRRRVKRALLQNKEKGLPHGGLRKFGYSKQDGNGLIVDDTEAAVIRECAERILAGSGAHSVATWLNETGVKTSTGSFWRGNVLRRCLESDWHVKFGILDKGTSVRVKAMLKRKGIGHNTAPWQRGEFLLSGLLHCSNCGAVMYHSIPSKKDGKVRTANRYACPPQRGCGRIGIKQSDADAYVAEEVYKLLTAIPLPVPAENAPAAPDTRALDAALAKKQSYIDAAAMFEPKDLADALANVNREIASEREKLDTRVVGEQEYIFAKEVREQLSQMTEADWFTGVDIEEQRHAIGVAFERIEVLPTKVRGGRSTVPPSERIVIKRRAL
jgi:site-specific DNA recombinase